MKAQILEKDLYIRDIDEFNFLINKNYTDKNFNEKRIDLLKA